jgi:hypothetical protein
LIAVIPCRDKLPRTTAFFSQLFFRKQPDHLLGNPIACVPHPIHPVKQQSQLSKNEFHDRQHSTPIFSEVVEPTGIEPVTSSLQS